MGLMGPAGGVGSVTAGGSVQSGALANGIVFSGNIASGQVGWPHLASGAVRSGHVGDASVLSGSVASGQLFDSHFSSGAVINQARNLVSVTFVTVEPISGAAIGCAVAVTSSGHIQTAMAAVSGRMPAIGVAISDVLSGQPITVYRAGHLVTQAFNFSGWIPQQVFVGRSGQVVASGPPTLSGDIQQCLGVAFGQSGLMIQIGDALEPVQIASGDIASGTIGYNEASSGLVARAALMVAPLHSGTPWSILTEELISGQRAVAISKSGRIRIAMAAVSGRMPAVGVVYENVASGIPANVYTDGAFQFLSGMMDYSGYLGQRVWVGRSGQIVTMSGSWNSGGHLSGDWGQALGIALNSGAAVIRISTMLLSGGPAGAVNIGA